MEVCKLTTFVFVKLYCLIILISCLRNFFLIQFDKFCCFHAGPRIFLICMRKSFLLLYGERNIFENLASLNTLFQGVINLLWTLNRWAKKKLLGIYCWCLNVIVSWCAANYCSKITCLFNEKQKKIAPNNE